MRKSFYELIQADIREKLKSSNIVIWYDYQSDFKQEFELFDEEGVNKIAYEGSFIELRYKILKIDSELIKKWLIYSPVKNRQGFLTEYEYFGEVYVASVKDILERVYRIDFGRFDIATLEDRLNILKKLWDIIPENTIRNLDQETLDNIVLTNGFGYVDISKEYTILKYICETDKYESILQEARIKDKFFEFICLEYGIDVLNLGSKEEVVENIVENLFQSELIQKSRDKGLRPFGIEIKNPNKVMNCVQLLETWANHEVYKGKFLEYSRMVSPKYMKSILELMGLEELFSIEYLIGVDEILYKKLEIQIIKGENDSESIKDYLITHLSGVGEDKNGYNDSDGGINIDALKNQLDDLKTFVDIRRRYYFSKAKIFNQWNILNNIFQIIDLIYDFEEQSKTMDRSVDGIIGFYEHNSCWKIDCLYRKVQEDYSLMDNFITVLLDYVDRKYHYQYLKPLNEEMSSAIEMMNDYKFNTDIQLDFWSKYVSSTNKKTAVFIVDALRYEMGRDLFSKIGEIGENHIKPLISSIPTVTEFGMASLLPNGYTRLRLEEENGELKIIDGNFGSPLNNKSERVKFFAEQAGSKGLVKNLNEIADAPLNRLKTEFKGRDRILIFSNEIDEAGHIQDSSIQMFPSLISKIENLIDKVSQTDVERIVIVADHGFILTSGMEEWMKVELPKEMDNIVKKRRYTVSKNKIEGNYITKSAYCANYDSRLYLNFPRGINIFPANGGTKFYHGGISLQEMLVPVIVIEKSDKKFAEKYVPQESEQIEISFEAMEIKRKSLAKKQREIPRSVKEQIEYYLENQELNKRERKILELFLNASSYTDSEIQEICALEGMRFVSKSVMKFMEDFIKKLNEQGHDWIGFTVVGMSTYEYYLK